MPRLNIDELHVSDSVRRLNPELFGLGRLPPAQPQPDSLRPLVRQDQGKEDGQKRLASHRRSRNCHGPRIHVGLVAFRRAGRELDRDNLIGGLKWLRDAIAAWLGVDDAEACIDWTYSQHQTRGREGVGVKIEV